MSPWEAFLFPRPSLLVLEKLPNDTQLASSPLPHHSPISEAPQGQFCGVVLRGLGEEAHPMPTAKCLGEGAMFNPRGCPGLVS